MFKMFRQKAKATRGRAVSRLLSVLIILATLSGLAAPAAYAVNGYVGLPFSESEDGSEPTVNIDGRPMTLDELRAMVAEPGADMNRKIDLDGTTVTLGNLKTMVEIEDELQRYADSFIDPSDMPEEQRLSYESILRQMQTTGISIEDDGLGKIMPMSAQSEVSVTYDHTARLTVPPAATVTNGAGTTTITFTQPSLTYATSFHYETASGNALAGNNYTAAAGTVTFAAGETSKTIDIEILHSTDRWTGVRSLLVQLSDAKGILFDNGHRGATVEIYISNNYNYKDVSFNQNKSINKESITAFIGHRESFLDGHNEIFPTEPDGNEFMVTDRSETFDIAYWAPITTSAKERILDGRLDRIEIRCDFIEGSKINWGTVTVSIEDAVVIPETIISSGTVQIGLTPSQLALIAAAPHVVVRHVIGAGDGGENETGTLRVYGISWGSTGTAEAKVTAVSVPPATYSLGQKIPITVTYSMVVKARWSDITVNGDVVSAVNDSGNSTIDRSLTYLYTVKEQDAPSVTVTQTRVTNFITEDLTEPSDNVKKKDNTSRPFGDAKISIAKEPAIASVNTVDADKNDKTDFSAAGGGAYVEIGLNEAAAQWIQGGGLDKIKVSIDGGATLLPVQWKTKPTGGDFTDRLITESPITLPANGALVDEPYRAEVFLQYDDAGAYDILIGQYKDFKVLAAKYPTGISIDAAASYPPGNVIYFKTPPTMKAVLSPEGAENYEPTPVITWSSSAPDVATIEASTGKVNAVKEGDVKFTASVQGESGKLTATTETLTVVDSGEPFIDLPDTITTRIQTDTTVTWTTNVVNKMTNKSQEAKFTVTVKNLSNQTVNEQIIIDKTSCVIPGAALTVPSAGVAPAYTVTVTCKNPDDAGAAELTDTANIVTRALPLVVRFNVLESYYITDETTTVPLTASFGNRDTTSGAAYNYKVVKNGEAVTVTDAAATGYMNETKTFDLAIDSVSSKLRDIYIVSIEAYNPGDELSPSTDSFILYVYQNGVIDITAGGNQATALTLNNAGKTGIADKLQPVTATGDITKLRENANLQSTLSIDSKGYAWSNVEDQIQWSSDDDLTASLNYQQGGFYGNINDYDYTSYRPSSEFMLVGHRDGTAKITATHAKTSESAVLNVDVTTLKDKLYVFNIFPRKITTLTYTNGASTERKLTTNSYGEIAIYEPDGIASDISATSGAGDTLMMGTIYSALLSSEKDPSKMELYPVNIFKLRPAAKVELFILKEDGTPLTGNLTVSGGVYKNGKYCTATQIKDEPYAIDKDGKLTIAMDPDKFWATSNDEGLTPSDQLDYVFIARTPGDEYYPLYIKVDGSVNADDSVVFATNAVVAEKVPSGKKNKPFISEIAARHTNAGAVWSPILRHNGIIGISDAAPEMEVNTTVLWWGENAASGADYTVYFEDAYGKRFDGQRVSSVTRYPFSDLAVSENVTVLNKDTILAKTGETLHPKTRLQKGSSLVLLQDTAFTIINGVGLPDMTKDQNLQNNLDSLLGPGGNGAFGADGSDAKFNQGGDMSSPGLAMLFKMLKTDFSSDYLTMKFKPTTNPLEWEFYIQVGLDFIGDSNTNADGGKNQMMIDQSANKFSYLPGPIDAYQMIKGTFAENAKSAYKDAIKSGVGNEKSYGVKLGGFYEGMLVYENGSWTMRTRSGGFTIGAAFGYTWNVNTWVGPIPVVASASVGAGLEVDMKILMTEHGEGSKTKYLQNQLVTLRINAYLKAFVGIGFDYSVVAVKFGVFGQVDLKNYNAWLTKREDDGEETSLSGQWTDLRGTVGIEFYLKILFIKYRKILASHEFKVGTWETGEWDDIEAWRVAAKFPNDFGGFGATTFAQNMMLAYAASPAQLETVSEGMYVEDRDYLDLEERVWGGGQPPAARLQSAGFGPQSIDVSNKLENLQSNSYPYANPFVTDNGDMVVFLSDGDSTDLDATRVEYTRLQNGAYAAPQPVVGENEFIDEKYGDSNLQFDSKGNMSVAAWQSQTKKLELDPGQPATADDLNAMMNATDIYASVYSGNTWATARLTNNSAADMAPVTATNGSRAIVIWRRLAATSTDNVESMEFDARDDLMYSVYNGAAWEPEKQLYNGTSGAVKGLSAAMDAAGNTLVAYTVDTARYVGNTAGASEQKLDIAYSLIDSAGDVAVLTMFLTNDAAPDENPQVTTATLNGAERFITAWYTQQPLADDAAGGSVSDIRLQVIDGNGFPYDDFPGGINEINQNSSVAISNQFRFGNSTSGNIEDLTLVWIAPEMDDAAIPEKGDAQTMDTDSVYAIRFLQENDDIYVTAPMPIVEPGENTKVDHVDAYLSGANEIKAVLQTTTYDITKGSETVDIEERIDGEDVVVGTVTIATPISAMKTATGNFKNAISAGDPIFNYAEVRHSNSLPLQVTVANLGKEAITGIKVTTQDAGDDDKPSTRSFDGLKLMPNSSVTLIVYHPLADEGKLIKNITVTTAATFGTGGTISESSEAQTQVADTGIGSLAVTKEENKVRDIQIKLYNQSEIELAGMHTANQSYNVKIGFYNDNLSNDPATGVTLVPGETGMTAADESNVFTVDEDRLTLIDNGAFVGNFKYALPGTGFADGDIPLYATVWIEDTVNGEKVTVPEVYAANNAGSVFFTDPVARNNGVPIQITAELSVGGSENTVADITVKNLAWADNTSDETGGNLIVTLLDGEGAALETLRSVDILQGNGLIQLGGEDSKTITFEFSQPGETVNASYVVLSKTATDNTLSALRVDGVALEFDPATTEYTADVENLFAADVNAIAAYPGASVSARLIGGAENTLTSTDGVLSGRLSLDLGGKGTVTENVIEVTVTPYEGTASQTYRVTLNDTFVDDTDSAFVNTGRVSLEAPAWIKTSGEMQITASLSGFTAAPTGYTTSVASAQHGNALDWDGTNESGTVTVTIPEGEGRHSLSVRVYDEKSYYTEATATVTLDETAPVISDIVFEETDVPLISAMLQSAAPTNDGITDKQLKVHFKVTDAVSGVNNETVKVIVGGKEYTAIPDNSIYTATVTQAFTGELKLVACDNAGNETEESKEVLIDDALDVGTITTVKAETTQTSAKLYGAATTETHLIRDYGIEWRVKPQTQTDEGWTTLSLVKDGESKAEGFSVSVSIPPDPDPNPEIVYEYRAFVEDTIGSSHYGDTNTFRVLPCACEIEGVAITNAPSIEIPFRDATATITLASEYTYENNGCTAHSGDEENAEFTTSYSITDDAPSATLEGDKLTVNTPGTVTVKVTVVYKVGEHEVTTSEAPLAFTVTKQAAPAVTSVIYAQPDDWNPSGTVTLTLSGVNMRLAHNITVTATAVDGEGEPITDEEPITATAEATGDESGNFTATLEGIQNTSTDEDKTYALTVTMTVDEGGEGEDRTPADMLKQLVVPRAPKTGAEILEYSVEEQLAPAEIDSVERTITVVVPRSVKLDELSDTLEDAAQITLSPNAKIEIEAREVSGATLTVTYLVTAENGNTNNYTARISLQPLFIPAPESGGEKKTGGEETDKPADEAVMFPIVTGERVENSDGSVTLPNGGKLELENGVTVQTDGETTIADDTITMAEGVAAVITQPDGASREVSSNYTIFTDGSVRWSSVFGDVPGNEWYYGDVEYVYENKLFTGTAAGEFSPGMTADRAMLATVLWRHAGSPDSAGGAFRDVDAGSYYYDAVSWAAENGIVNGVGDGRFDPNADITREQLATLIYRYAAQTDTEFREARPYDGFADADKIAGYADEAVKALYCAGIISGKPDGVFDPQGKATRAEVAAIIRRFLEYGK